MSSRWWAKWKTPTLRTVSFMSERFSHEVRWIPDTPDTSCAPFARASSSSSAHTVRLLCSIVSQQLESRQTWAASTFNCFPKAASTTLVEVLPFVRSQESNKEHRTPRGVVLCSCGLASASVVESRGPVLSPG